MTFTPNAVLGVAGAYAVAAVATFVVVQIGHSRGGSS